jgi:hypothetical protein
VAEEALVGGNAYARALDLSRARGASQLPRDLAHLRNRLRWDSLTKARQASRRIDGKLPT